MDTRNKEHRLGTIPALARRPQPDAGRRGIMVRRRRWLRTPATPARTPPSVVVTSDVPYESANPVLTPGVLDVYCASGGRARGRWS